MHCSNNARAVNTPTPIYFLIIFNKYNLQQCTLVLLKFIIKPIQNDKKAMGESYVSVIFKGIKVITLLYFFFKKEKVSLYSMLYIVLLHN